MIYPVENLEYNGNGETTEDNEINLFEKINEIEREWDIPEVIVMYSDEQSYTNNNYIINDHDDLLQPPPPISKPIKRSMSVSYEDAINSKNPHIKFMRLEYANIASHSPISKLTKKMVYLLLNMKILESYKKNPEYWEDVDIKDYLYNTDR
jgi:hypothetical protein